MSFLSPSDLFADSSQERQLSFSESIINTVPDPIFVKDEQHRWIMVNDAFCTFMGVPRKDLLGRSDFDFFPAEEAQVSWEKDREVFESNSMVENEESFTDADGIVHTISTKKAVFDGPSSRILVGVIRNISDLKEKERQLKNTIDELRRAHQEIAEHHERLAEQKSALTVANELANKASETKSRFLAHMSHEVRTPLNGILGIGKLLEDTVEEQGQKELVHVLNNSSASLLNIVNNVLDIAKIEANELNLDRTSFDIIELCLDIISLWDKGTREDSITWVHESNIPDNCRLLSGDKNRLRQVIGNLVGNAKKFTPDYGAIVVRSRLLAQTTKQVKIRVSVADTGIGIDDEKLKHIFKPFQQADDTITREYGGTGLGLSICSELLALMGSSLHVRSRINCGSVFYFDLMLPRATSAVQQSSDSLLAVNFDKLKDCRVLVAEDNSVNQMVVKRILEKYECLVSVVSDGRQAVELCTLKDFDMILMDVQMPVLDGLSAVKRIRLMPRHATTPIIALTAHAMKGDERNCRAAGMDDYLSKPVEAQKLINRILRRL